MLYPSAEQVRIWGCRISKVRERWTRKDRCGNTMPCSATWWIGEPWPQADIDEATRDFWHQLRHGVTHR
jgi:hypothetical protein